MTYVSPVLSRKHLATIEEAPLRYDIKQSSLASQTPFRSTALIAFSIGKQSVLWNGIGLAYETKNKVSTLIRRRAYHLFRKTNDQTQISRINNHTHDSGHAQTKDSLLVRSNKVSLHKLFNGQSLIWLPLEAVVTVRTTPPYILINLGDILQCTRQ